MKFKINYVVLFCFVSFINQDLQALAKLSRPVVTLLLKKNPLQEKLFTQCVQLLINEIDFKKEKFFTQCFNEIDQISIIQNTDKREEIYYSSECEQLICKKITHGDDTLSYIVYSKSGNRIERFIDSKRSQITTYFDNQGLIRRKIIKSVDGTVLCTNYGEDGSTMTNAL